MLAQIGHDARFGTAHKTLTGTTRLWPSPHRLPALRNEPVLEPW